MKFFSILNSNGRARPIITRFKNYFLFKKIFNEQAFFLFSDFKHKSNPVSSNFFTRNRQFSSSSSRRSSEFNFFFMLLAKYNTFKISFFSNLAVDQSWAGLSHIFWFKTKISYFMNNWIYTTNHKRIAVNYFWFVILSGIVGMVLATLIRLEFAYPGAGVFVGDSLQYLSLATAHGVIMVFFMIMPLLFGAFANFLLPTQLGVHDVAFPRLNSAAFWFLPGGLLMLCQLVCVDKRYQRMNCFNIREIQSILKKKFFPNLINTHDRRDLLDKTALGLRFKTSSESSILSNTQIFFNFGTNFSTKTKSDKYYSLENPILDAPLTFNNGTVAHSVLCYFKSNSLLNLFFTGNSLLLFLSAIAANLTIFITTPLISLTTMGLNFLLTFYLFIYSFFNFMQTAILQIFFLLNHFLQIFENFLNFVKILKNISNFFKNFYLNDEGSTINNFSSFVSFTKLFFLSIYNLLYVILNGIFSLVNRFFTWILSLTSFDLTNLFNFFTGEKTNFFHKYFFSNLHSFFYFKINNFYFTKLNSRALEVDPSHSFDYSHFENSDNSDVFRELKFFNPAIKYNYKSGDYFPKFSKETYTHLFSVLTDLSSLGKLSIWFQSGAYFDLIANNAKNFFDSIELNNSSSAPLKSWGYFIFNPSDGFYNFFFELANNANLLNFQYVSTANTQQKFYKMFHTNSLQQRILANWRQLKFTREAWRCKLLSARHQKTLFRRYTHEDGIFWSIERNAKDLLPGWAMITPFSSRTRFTAIGKTDIGLMGVLLVLNSSIISAANFLVTYRYLSTLNNRKMRDARSFFTEGVMVSSWMMVTANPMLVIGIIMLLSDRHWQTSFFDYSGGGDTVLFQHMFWFFGHPEVYIIIIPTFGFTNTMLSFYFRKRVSARASLLYSMYTIAFLGFFVWGHHMYMVGLAHTTRMLFSTLTVMISVPAATKIMHWCVTFVNSSFSTELPLLFILTFIFFFVSGGISGMCVAHTGMDVLFHDTFYVIGHFHVMLAGAAMFASFGAFYFYFPAIFGVKYSRLYAYLHYTYYLIGQLMTVIPMFWLGYAGMPRRVLDYPSSMGGWHSVISAGHMLSVAGLMSFFIMIFDSLRQGRAVVRNTFGVSRYNTRLNFYLFSIGHHIYAQQKGLFLFKFGHPGILKLNSLNYTNYEPLETTLISYTFYSKNS